MGIQINTTADEARAWVKRVRTKGMLFASVGALNSGLWQAKVANTKKLSEFFKKPKGVTKNAIVFSKATMGKPTARVFAKGADGDDTPNGVKANKWLRANVFGGIRRRKKSDIAISNIIGKSVVGILSKEVRGKGAYGQISGKKFENKILPALRNAGGTRSKRGSGAKNKFYITKKKVGNRPAGVWERHGRGAKKTRLLLLIKSRARYKRKYQFERITVSAIFKNYHRDFDRALMKFMTT